MKVADFNYCLPQELIAQNPMAPRDSARLFIYFRQKNCIRDSFVRHLPHFLSKNDVLVLNKSKVFKARLHGFIAGHQSEILLIKKIKENSDSVVWSIMAKPARRFKRDLQFKISEAFIGVVLPNSDENSAYRLLSFPKKNFWFNIEYYGDVPFPPYITDTSTSFSQYQTVFADTLGSIAAPTAGLHFTSELLEKLRGNGVHIEFVTLHIGPGTFIPVRCENIEEHSMQSEFFELDEPTTLRLNSALKQGKRIIAVGTTSVKVLETCAFYAGSKTFLQPCSGETDLFIYPGYRWKIVHGMLTNFHLPKSTLLMLVASFLGKEKVLELYQEAIVRKYRFYSFGDAMLIV